MWKPAVVAVCLLLPRFVQAAEAPRPLSPTEAYDYVVGTQTFCPEYQFTTQPRLIETAQAILDMGSNVIKFGIGKDLYYNHNGQTLRNIPAKHPEVHSLTDLVSKEPYHRQVLEMPFAYYLIWTYPFSARISCHGYERFATPFSDEETQKEYAELREFVAYLLKTYSGTHKTFYLGHWEGDWLILGHFDAGRDPSPEQIKNMIHWLNFRQRAVDDAKRTTPHHDVEVYQYTEVNLVRKGMQGHRCLTNDVVPKTNIDYVSYSSYDSLGGDTQANLTGALSYIESKLPPKPGIPGKRVFIGEYGTPARDVGAEGQDALARKVIKAGLTWGCPFVLYWQMYCNDVRNGKHAGFWLIDKQGQKQPSYFTHERFCKAMRQYVADFQQQSGRVPTTAEFRQQALKQLDTPR
jgi:hypothetical protein